MGAGQAARIANERAPPCAQGQALAQTHIFAWYISRWRHTTCSVASCTGGTHTPELRGQGLQADLA